jgi:hypothetical protein
MKFLSRALNVKPLVVVCLIGALITISTFPGRAEAMFVPAAPSEDAVRTFKTAGNRAADMARIQAVLESKVVRQKLMDLGLSPEEAMVRINRLSDEQVHQFASRIDSLQAGGGVIELTIIVLLVIVIILLV